VNPKALLYYLGGRRATGMWRKGFLETYSRPSPVTRRPSKFLAGILSLLSVLPVLSKPAPKEPFLAVARHVAGPARVLGKDTTVAREVKLGDVISSNRVLITGENGVLVLRFHPDFARFESRANTRYRMAYSRIDSTKPRRLKLEQGQLVLGVPKRSPPVQGEDLHSQVRADNARFSFASDPNSASTFIVLDGTITVHNRAKDVTAVVRRGQKAVSDVNGLRITDATDAELEQVGLRQNMLEVDFWNPETEEFSTLEVEYESNF
jgi:hypothetical protein